LELSFKKEKREDFFERSLLTTEMGSINRFNLPKIKSDYKVPCFFETGTWKGDAVQYALDAGFEKIISVEIIPELAQEAAKRFSQIPGVKIITGDSVSVMQKELPVLKFNCVFWLDAHFPGADAGIYKYDEEIDEDLRLPLESEIKTISASRRGYRDIIIVDDLRIYEDGPFTNGNAPKDVVPLRKRNIDFIYDYCSLTHTIHRIYSDEGYVLLLPKKKFPWLPKFRTRDPLPLYVLE
jgi:hypothetical protein